MLWPAGQPWPYRDEWHEGPVAVLPVAQLYVRDAPLPRPPGQADPLQVLWCPSEHPPEYKPPTALFRRSAAEATDVLAAPPEPSEVEYDSMRYQRVRGGEAGVEEQGRRRNGKARCHPR